MDRKGRSRHNEPRTRTTPKRSGSAEIISPRPGILNRTGGGKNSGFTLLEILIALTIFTIASVSLSVVFPATSMAVRQVREYTDIALLLDNQLAVIRATPFDQLATKSITTGLPNYVTQVDWTVTPDAAFSDLKLVNISVTYTSKERTRVETIETCVANL